MSCDEGEVTERLENEQSFTYVIGSSLTSPGERPMIQGVTPLLLRSSCADGIGRFWNIHRIHQIPSPRRFVPGYGRHPQEWSLRSCSFSNPYFASPTSQAIHLRHLASRPWHVVPSLALSLESKDDNRILKIDTSN